MNEFLQWYWDWGIAVSGLAVFVLGFTYGAAWQKDRCEKKAHNEAYRLAVTNTIPESAETSDSHLQSDLSCNKTSQVKSSEYPDWIKTENP